MRHPRWRVPFSRGGIPDSAGSRPLEEESGLSAVRNFLRSAFSAPPIRLAFLPLAFRFIASLLSPFFRLLPSSFRFRWRDDSIAYRKGRFCTRVTGNVPSKLYPRERARDRYVVFHDVPAPRTRIAASMTVIMRIMSGCEGMIH